MAQHLEANYQSEEEARQERQRGQISAQLLRWRETVTV